MPCLFPPRVRTRTETHSVTRPGPLPGRTQPMSRTQRTPDWRAARRSWAGRGWAGLGLGWANLPEMAAAPHVLPQRPTSRAAPLAVSVAPPSPALRTKDNM